MDSQMRRYRGVLAEHSHGEADNILFLDGENTCADPLAEQISDDIDAHGRYLTVRYWTAAKRQSDEVMIEGAIRAMLGDGSAKYASAYSETTGYLWTDEELNVGGHDLLAELRSHLGEYCLLEITYAAGPTPNQVQDLVAQEIRECRVRLAEDLLARLCKAGEPVPQVVADWAMSHGVSPDDCPRCRDGG